MPPGRLFTHRNCLAIKWPRGAWLLLSGMWPHAGIKQHVTNIFQLQFSWVLLGAHKIQEYCHVLGQLSSTATAVSCNMWQLSKTFAQSGPSNIHQASRCQSEIQWIQIFKLDPLYFAYIFAYLLSSQLQMCLKPGHWHSWSWARMDFHSQFCI